MATVLCLCPSPFPPPAASRIASSCGRATPFGTAAVRGARTRMRKLAVSGVLNHALKGAVQEVMAVPGLYQRIRVFLAIAVIFYKEASGMVSALPALLYALQLHRSLPVLRLGKELLIRGGKRAKNAAVVDLSRRASWPELKPYKAFVMRDVRFGGAERNVLDVYVPHAHSSAHSVPVVVFVHGGIWAMGDKWQFCALGACLADNGILAVLVQYTLFPDVLAAAQAEEVSGALSWTMDNIRGYGGDPDRVFLMGHSAGAHLSALVLWERANLRNTANGGSLLGQGDTRQPHCFIGLAGVYDIGEHYKYEAGRGVASLSCMKPAMGGPAFFEAMSPTLLFRSLLGQDHRQRLAHNPDKHLVPPCFFYTSHSDIVVPAESSIAFWEVLVDAGYDARLILHNSLCHDDFAFWDKGWLKDTRCAPLVKDLLTLVGGLDLQDALPFGGVAGATELKHTCPDS